MSDINIPFNTATLRQLVAGQITAIARYKPYGRPGDTFAVNDAIYALLHVEKVSLGFVSEHMYKATGHATSREFREAWVTANRKDCFYPNEIVFLHTFYKCGTYLSPHQRRPGGGSPLQIEAADCVEVS
jgi:hypothetical protein